MSIRIAMTGVLRERIRDLADRKTDQLTPKGSAKRAVSSSVSEVGVGRAEPFGARQRRMQLESRPWAYWQRTGQTFQEWISQRRSMKHNMPRIWTLKLRNLRALLSLSRCPSPRPERSRRMIRASHAPVLHRAGRTTTTRKPQRSMRQDEPIQTIARMQGSA